MTHPFWTLPVNASGGALLLTPCPGTKNVSLSDSLNELVQAGAKALVSLMPLDEQLELGLDLATACHNLNLAWYLLPIADDAAPTDEFEQLWQQYGPAIHRHLNCGEAVAIHCKGGSGRTGLVAARLLLERDWTLDWATEAIQALRPTALSLKVQVDYLKALGFNNNAVQQQPQQ